MMRIFRKRFTVNPCHRRQEFIVYRPRKFGTWKSIEPSCYSYKNVDVPIMRQRKKFDRDMVKLGIRKSKTFNQSRTMRDKQGNTFIRLLQRYGKKINPHDNIEFNKCIDKVNTKMGVFKRIKHVT